MNVHVTMALYSISLGTMIGLTLTGHFIIGGILLATILTGVYLEYKATKFANSIGNVTPSVAYTEEDTH